MPRRTSFCLESLEARVTPSASRLFATSQDVGSTVLVYEATGPRVVGGDGYVFNSGTGRFVAALDAYVAPFGGGVHLALGDVTGDGIEDLVTAPAGGGGPHIKVFDGASLLRGQAVVVREFMAFDSHFFGGEYLAVGQVDPGTRGMEIIVGAGLGGGPHVRVFAFDRAGPIRDFFAFDASFRGGVRVAAGDVTRDGRADVIAAMGPGGEPQVRAFDMTNASPRTIVQFLAYDRGFRGGVYVATGALDLDGGAANIATGAGEGGAPHVHVWNVSGGQATVAYSFFAGDINSRAGVRVAVGNLGQLSDRDTLYAADGFGSRGFSTGSNNSDPRLRAYNLSLFIPMGTPGSIPQSYYDYTESDLDLFDGFARTRAGGLNLG